MYFFLSFLARLKLTASKFRCQPVWCASFDCLHCVLRLRRFPFSLLMWHRWKYHVPTSDVIPLPVPLSLFPLYRSPSWAELKEPRNCMLCCRSRTILHTLLMDKYACVCVCEYIVPVCECIYTFSIEALAMVNKMFLNQQMKDSSELSFICQCSWRGRIYKIYCSHLFAIYFCCNPFICCARYGHTLLITDICNFYLSLINTYWKLSKTRNGSFEVAASRCQVSR